MLQSRLASVWLFNWPNNEIIKVGNIRWINNNKKARSRNELTRSRLLMKLTKLPGFPPPARKHGGVSGMRNNFAFMSICTKKSDTDGTCSREILIMSFSSWTSYWTDERETQVFPFLEGEIKKMFLKKGKLFGATKLSPGQRKGVARINILPPAERDPIRRFDFYVFTNENRTADSWTSPVENLKCRTGRIN